MIKQTLLAIALCLIALSLFAQNTPTGISQPAPDRASPPAVPSQITPGPLSEALQSYRTGKFEAALEQYAEALRQNSQSDEAYAGLARTYLKLEKIQPAWETATKGIGALPAAWAIHTALGEVYFRQGKITEAEQEFVKVVNSHQPEARAYFGLARVYDSISLYARARVMIDKAHKLDGGDPEIRLHWLETLKRSEKVKALEDYLANPGNDDAEVREGLQHYLKLLLAREQQPRKNCKVVNPLPATQTDLQPIRSGPNHLDGYGLKVNINGRSSNLQLDTGAGGIVIGRHMAEKAGVQPLSESKIRGFGDKGEMDAYFGYADSIQIGGLEFRNCLVEVMDKRSVMGGDGLIGADVFSDYLVTIDFPDEKLRLSELPKRPNESYQATSLTSADEEEDQSSDAGAPATDQSNNDEDKKATQSPASSTQIPKTQIPKTQIPKTQTPGTQSPTIRGPQDRYIAPEMNSYTKIFRFGHELLIPTWVGDAPPKLFLIDTGAFANIISPDAAREVTKIHQDARTHVQGLSGSVEKVYRADRASLRFSHFMQDNLDLVTFDMSRLSKHTGVEVSGTLGFNMLKMLVIRIDYRDGLVDFAYDPNRRPR